MHCVGIFLFYTIPLMISQDSEIFCILLLIPHQFFLMNGVYIKSCQVSLTLVHISPTRSQIRLYTKPYITKIPNYEVVSKKIYIYFQFRKWKENHQLIIKYIIYSLQAYYILIYYNYLHTVLRAYKCESQLNLYQLSKAFFSKPF